MDRVYLADSLDQEVVYLGRQMDNIVRDVCIDVSAWLEKWPDGVVTIYVISPNGTPYLADGKLENGVLHWTVTEADTADAGSGEIQLILNGASGERLHSANGKTRVAPSISSREPTTPPPAHESWVNSVTEAASNAFRSEQAAAQSAERAEQAAAHNGYIFFEIDESGHLIMTKTENVETLDFQLNNGRLEVVYG